MKEAFAIWITGLPASGKTTLATAVARGLENRGISPAVIESDLLRRMLFRHPRFDDGERDIFYDAMAGLGAALVGRGVPVIFAATANLRAYRDRARDRIARFAEVYVDCPLAVCEARDPKAIYRRAREGGAPHVPGVGAEYEPPLAPDVVVRGDKDAPSAAARRIVGALAAKGWL